MFGDEYYGRQSYLTTDHGADNESLVVAQLFLRSRHDGKSSLRVYIVIWIPNAVVYRVMVSISTKTYYYHDTLLGAFPL